jgi:hypothetical protein
MALARDKRLNIEADLLADKIRAEARGPYRARPNFPHWPVDKAAMFIQGTKVTSGIKQQLASQLSNSKLKYCIIEKEKWTQYTFDSVAWHGGNMKLHTKGCPRTGESISVKRASISGTQEGRMGGIMVGRYHVACAMH